MPDQITAAPDVPRPVTRAEWVLVGFLVVTGVVLRCWQPHHMAVEHFDEGVYASNLYCPPQNAYPFRHLYAPPLLPALLEWALILSGGIAGSVMAVNVIAGCLLIPSVWWVGRQWFGPIAGLTAAALATFSEVHIFYSRTALTDGLLCLWLLWGVYWAWRAIVEGRPIAILLAGTFACLTWWTKYNGWLTLAISGTGTLAWLIVDRLVTPRFAGHFQCPAKPLSAIFRWIAVATIAVVGWLPYLISLHGTGGYAAVAANHAGYFVGPSGWWEGLVRQTANLKQIDSGWTAVGLIAGLIFTVMLQRLRGHLPNEAGTSPRQVKLILIAIILGGAACLAITIGAGLTAVLFAVALIGMLPAIWWTIRGREEDGSRRLALWMLAAWFVGLLVAIPLYHPYLRLTLPLVVAGWLGTGLAFSLLRPEWLGMTANAQPDEATAPPARLLITAITAIAVIVGLFAFQAWRKGADAPPAWEDRRGLQIIATEVLESLPTDEAQLVYVIGEPGLFFHLALQSDSQRRAILPAGDLASLSAPDSSIGPVAIYTLLGPHVAGNQDPAASVSWAAANATLVAEWPYRPSTLVLLNQYAPAQIAAGIEPETIRLLRIGE